MGSCGKLRINNYTITMSSLFQQDKSLHVLAAIGTALSEE